MTADRSPREPGEIVRIPFHGDDILAVEVDGKPHIVLKHAIESIGLDYTTQLQKLDGKSWATVGLSPMVASDGRSRPMRTCNVRTFLMLLATIDERRVSDTARPKLVAYQAEVADAIEKYWTEGGAINPRASEGQLERIANLTERRLSMLRMAAGLVDPKWLEAKTRHEVARGLGEEPEVNADDRPLTVGEYLKDLGVTGAALRSVSTKFGKALKALYVAEHGREPMPTERFVDGALRQVAGYTESDRPLFDRVYRDMFNDELGDTA